MPAEGLCGAKRAVARLGRAGSAAGSGILRRAAAVATSALLGACAASQDVVDPHTVSLEAALVGTVDALAAAHAESIRTRSNFGFYGCSVTAVFNVSATGTKDNKLTIAAAGPPAPAIPVSLSGTASSEATASGTRANTVTVVFDTKYCLPKDAAASAAGAKKGGAEAGRRGAAPGPVFDVP